MKQSLDLNTFAKALTDKGYDGYFFTQAAYPGKLKESIGSFLEAFRNCTDKPVFPDTLLLKTYLEWNGEDKPKVECNMWVKWENETFDVHKMNIERKDRYGHLMKKSELTNLTTEKVPVVKEALAKVLDTPKQPLFPQKRRFRM